MNLRYWFAVGALGLAISASSTYGQMPVSKVVTDEARVIEAPATITLVGSIGPARRSAVGAEIDGRVAEMPARQGDFIEKDGVLCRLDDEVLSLELAEANARLEALRSRHDELLAGTRAEELARLQALAREAAAEHERWEFDMQRVDNLYEGSDSNQKEYYDTRAELRAAEQRMLAQQAAYDLALKGPRAEVIAQAAHDVAEQQAVVDRIEANLRKTVIRAPYTGYVVDRAIEVGEWVSVGGTVVEIVDLSSVLVRVNLPEAGYPYLATGPTVRVMVDALKRSFDGNIKHIVRQADRSARTFPIEIELDNRQGLLAAGMFVRATLTAGQADRVVAVSKDAVLERDGVSYVGMVMPGAQGGLVGMLTAVTLGADVGEWIAITSGNIAPGMQVVVRGNERLLPFPTPVQVVDETGIPVPMPEPGTKSPHGGGS